MVIRSELPTNAVARTVPSTALSLASRYVRADTTSACTRMRTLDTNDILIYIQIFSPFFIAVPSNSLGIL